MKILAFGGSTSSASINRVFANYVAGLVPEAEVTDLDLRQYQIPIYSIDEEEENGIPAVIKDFIALVAAHDALVISLAEHNGSYAAAYKNLVDWATREEYQVWANKPMLLLATSPGGRGGASVLAAAESSYPRLGADLKATFSLPSFNDNFSTEEGVLDADLQKQLSDAVAALLG